MATLVGVIKHYPNFMSYLHSVIGIKPRKEDRSGDAFDLYWESIGLKKQDYVIYTTLTILIYITILIYLCHK